MNDARSWMGSVVAILAAIALVAALWYGRQIPENPTPEAPDADAANVPAGWETKTEDGITFAYPPTLDTAYVSATDWPPTLAVSEEAFSCTEAGEPNVSGGQTAGTWLTPYQSACVTLRSEGAAGSVYRLYAYAIPRAEGQFLITFGLRYPQCANYDEPEQGACVAEQEAFNPDSLVAGILETFSSR